MKNKFLSLKLAINKFMACSFISLVAAITVASEKPNVLWIFADDLSHIHIETYGNKQTSTPSINKLASEGVLFSQAFSNNPICSPSRSSVITGMYPSTIDAHNHRSHAPTKKTPYHDGWTLPEPVKHISHYFQNAGYNTYNFDDKQDYNFTYTEKLWDGKKWSQLESNKPFFAVAAISKKSSAFEPLAPKDVDLPPYYVDHPVVREDLARILNSVTNEFDPSLAAILQNLRDRGVEKNTIVFFFSDHGKNGFSTKQWLYDGGIHVALIVKWGDRPDIIKPGQVLDDVVSLVDLAATSLDLAGIDVPEHMEGKVILGPNAIINDHIVASRDRGDETFHRIRAIRTKDFKYIKNYYPEIPYTQTNQYKDTNTLYRHYRVMKKLFAEGKLNKAQSLFFAATKPEEELYELKNDKWELNNLADDPKYAARLKSMRVKLKDWMEVRHESLGWRDKGAIPEKADKLFLIKQDAENASLVNIITTAHDIDGKTVALKVEYSLDGGNTWFKAAISDNVQAEYDQVVVDNNKPFQISGITTDNSGANTLRFQWDTQSKHNGYAALEHKVYDNVMFRTTQTNGEEVSKPVLSIRGFYRNFPAVLENNSPFSFDFSVVN